MGQASREGSYREETLANHRRLTGALPFWRRTLVSRCGRGSCMRTVVVIGTRPEAIKMAPVIKELKLRSSEKSETFVVSTGQHQEMMRPILELFRINPDFDLGLMPKCGSINSLFSTVVREIDDNTCERQPGFHSRSWRYNICSCFRARSFSSKNKNRARRSGPQNWSARCALSRGGQSPNYYAAGSPAFRTYRDGTIAIDFRRSTKKSDHGNREYSHRCVAVRVGTPA